MGETTEKLRMKLQAAFEPDRLEVVDDSARHAGHLHAQPGGESHFNVTIISSVFAGLSRIERQRLIHAALAEELAGPVHALSLKALTPGEA